MAALISTPRAHCAALECGAPIGWAVTKNGKLIPLDWAPNPDGNVVLDDELVPDGFGGEAQRATVLGHKAAATSSEWPRYMPHHATCPKVARFRR